MLNRLQKLLSRYQALKTWQQFAVIGIALALFAAAPLWLRIAIVLLAITAFWVGAISMGIKMVYRHFFPKALD